MLCDVRFSDLLDPRWPSEEGSMSRVFWEGHQVVRILICSTSEHKLHSRTSFVSVASAANLTVLTHCCCTEWLFRRWCCRRMKERACSRREESVFSLSFDYFRTQICVMFLLEHSRIPCFPPSTGELRPPVVPPRQRRLILSILPIAAFRSAGIHFLTPDLLFHPSRNQPPSKVSEMQCQARTLRAK